MGRGERGWGGRSTSSTAGASKFQGVNGTSERSDGGPFTYLALHPTPMITVSTGFFAILYEQALRSQIVADTIVKYCLISLNIEKYAIISYYLR